MKNIFKFAAMAFAAVVLAGGVTSCDNKEECEHINYPTPDMKQWITDMGGMEIIFDFGVTESGIIWQGMQMFAMMEDYTWYKNTMPFGWDYKITPKDATSGTITYLGMDTDMDGKGDPDSEVSITYSNLTAKSVTLHIGEELGDLDCTANYLSFEEMDYGDYE